MKNRLILERDICDRVKKDNNCSAHFIWSIKDSVLSCRLVTLNPRHNTHFLLCQESVRIDTSGEGEVESYYVTVLEKINSLLDAGKGKEEENQMCYVVQWKKKNWEESNLVLSDTYTSYFYGANLKEVVDKFYYEKSPDEIVVYHIEMVSAS